MAHFVIEQTRERHINKFNINGFDYKVKVEVTDRDITYPEAMQNLHNVLSEILAHLMDSVQPHHMVRLSIFSPLLHHEIWVPFMRADLLDVNRILTEVERVLQSNDEWLFDQFFITFVHAPIPGGGGKQSQVLTKYLHNKRCIIQVPSDSLNMCCARAIVTAIAKVDGNPHYEIIRKGRDVQSNLALKLQQTAQIPIGKVCSIEEFEKFQIAIGRDYQLYVYSRDYFNCCIFKGKEFAEKQVYLYHAENHFSVITSMSAFLEKTYFCKQCQLGYDHKASHTCKNGCSCCKMATKCSFTDWKLCENCHRYFVSEECYNNHITQDICKYIQCCNDCGQTFHKYHKHICGVKYCKYCRAEKPVSHTCYIQPLKQKKPSPEQPYIFFDFECLLDEENKHVPNLCVAHKVCGRCMTVPMNDMMYQCECEREQFIFKGESTLTDFCEFLFSGNHHKSIVISHNGGAYDVHLILPYIHNLGIKPTLIQNGKKILCLEACGLKFIDSINFFNTSLAKLPAIFGIQELAKGFFPHLFSTKQNQHYKGPIPEASFFDPDGMKPEKRSEFLAWYQDQILFDYQVDLEKYCISDVDILQRCCGKFRQIFMENTNNMEPFTTSITIASACNNVYRTLFLQDEEIAIIPSHGYNPDKQSVIAMCWLHWMEQTLNVKIKNAFSGGESILGGIKVDGLDTEGTIYQFQGCFWHGCERCYENQNTINPVNGQTMRDLRQKTRRTTERLRDRGYTVLEQWECDFRKEIKENEALGDFFAEYEPYKPLNPRDAFFGGRTNAIQLFYEAKDNEHIGYVDFTSLYPWVCKYGLFPLGHPDVYYGDSIPSKVTGLVRVKILPPRDLFHPVLPVRINKKLMFPLCKTCAEQCVQTPCTHTDEERAITGTWVTLEVEKAVEMNYIILESYVAWHFPKTTQYNSTTQQGGLWASYINLWLQQKQQADGYPSWCHTEQDKQKYISDYYKHEGIHLDPQHIERNEGLRSLCKLMLNSHWGKFGQNPQKKKIVYISDPKTYVEMMMDDKIQVCDIDYVNQEHIALHYQTVGEFVEPLPNTNVVLAAFVTAQARLRLYEVLHALGDRVLYFDTDSVIYVHKENEWNPPTGDFLGQLKDEVGGNAITAFCSGGAKNYAFTMANGESVCKIRGFTLNQRNSVKLNFETMKDLIMTPGEFDRCAEHKTVYTIEEPYKIVRHDSGIKTVSQNKQYRLVYDKRILVKETLKTYPYGWTGRV